VAITNLSLRVADARLFGEIDADGWLIGRFGFFGQVEKQRVTLAQAAESIFESAGVIDANGVATGVSGNF
jgi:hypothetical protein